jgi:kynurenine formamidase
MSSSKRWVNRPEGSNWGDFGPDDQRGRINLLTPEKVRQGIAEVKEGKPFCLSLPLDYPGGNLLNPRRHPPVIRPTLRNGRPNMNYKLFTDNNQHSDVVSDDLVVLHLQYSTQWDSLAHVGSLFDANGDGIPEAVYYNGYRAGEHIIGPTEGKDAGVPEPGDQRTTSNATALGIQNMAESCVQGRGVMVDFHAHFGNKKVIVDYDIMMRVLEQDKVEIEKGDMVALHTGFAQMLLDMKKKPDLSILDNSCAALDGRDSKLLNWITDSGLVVLMADNYAVEAHPATKHVGCCATLPLHEHCLFKLGIHLGEMFYLTELAQWLRKNGRNRFLLTAPPLRLPGAVGSPSTAVATV